ncbi:MAG: type IV pili methyl-accepting chemotaxis transducer N-terminal domain-containing protein [Campylobacteraceae bacterium]|jgi:PAS domain S-box-containing protein|nr:type IV pili methyl-accepting chemotaxis transducer N-terminal domain-containing protein [Campylobacteraceae bacterium]
MEQSKFYLTKRYIVALTLIALLSILAYINMSYLINSQSNDGKIIDASGQQVMLSQQIALYAIYYQTQQLESSIEQMETNHKFLLSLPMSKNIERIYFKEPLNLDTKIKTYIANAKRFRDTTDGVSLTYVLRNAEPLLQKLGEASALYLKETEYRTAKLKNFEAFICFTTLFALLLEALLIFRPANAAIERKTKELIDEKNYSNTVIESSSNAIISIDTDYRIKTFNRQAERIFGFKKEEVGHVENLQKMIPKIYRSIHKRGLLSFFAKNLRRLKSRSFEMKLLNKKNEQFPCRIGLSADENGIIVINIENMTKEKLKNTLLHKQAKFAALGEMIAIIAHQWRQPLSELGLNNMYLKKKITQKEFEDELNKNEEIIRFMSETITNFEDFYKNAKSVWFNPKSALEQALNITEKILILKGIKLFLEICEKTKIYGQQNSLAQVILSIIQNAIDKHGTNDNLDKWIKITMKTEDKKLFLRIDDNAGGIRVKPIETIFEPFYTSKKSSSTGLGLYMSKLIINDKFGGNLSASNTKIGASFLISMPYSIL